MNGNNIQAMMDGLSAQWAKERAETQMTLGKLIERLESMPEDKTIEAFDSPHSYRGYYSDLAFECQNGPTTAGEALKVARSCMGEIFEGYKGGDFQMGRNTPIWKSFEGTTGDKILSLSEDGEFKLGKDEY